MAGIVFKLSVYFVSDVIVANILGLILILIPWCSRRGRSFFRYTGIGAMFVSLTVLVVGMITAHIAYVSDETKGYILCPFAIVGGILWAIAAVQMCVLGAECNGGGSDVEMPEQQE